MHRNPNTDNTNARRKTIKQLSGLGGVAVGAVYAKPLVQTIILPAHAQTSLRAPLSLAVTASPASGINAAAKLAAAGENIQFNISVENPPGRSRKKFVEVAKADREGEASLRLSPEQLRTKHQLVLTAADSVVVVAKGMQSQKTQTRIVGATPVSTAVSVAMTASPTAGLNMTAKGLQASEKAVASIVVVSAEGKSKGKIDLTATASSKGVATFKASNSVLLSKYRVSLAAGDRLTAKVSGVASKRSGTKVVSIAGSTRLNATMMASVADGIDINVAGLRAAEVASLSLSVTSAEGKPLGNVKLDSKASAAGAVRQSLSTAQLASKYGVSLTGGERVQLAVTGKTSGLKGDANATVSGSVPLVMSAQASIDAGIAATVTKLKASEKFTTAIAIRSKTGESLASFDVAAQASAKGEGRVSLSPAELKARKVTLVGGETVRFSAVSASGARGAAEANVAEKLTPLTMDVTASASAGISLSMAGLSAADGVRGEIRVMSAKGDAKGTVPILVKTATAGKAAVSFSAEQLKSSHKVALAANDSLAISIQTTESRKVLSRNVLVAAGAITKPVVTKPVVTKPVVTTTSRDK